MADAHRVCRTCVWTPLEWKKHPGWCEVTRVLCVSGQEWCECILSWCEQCYGGCVVRVLQSLCVWAGCSVCDARVVDVSRGLCEVVSLDLWVCPGAVYGPQGCECAPRLV